ncbi:MAG TPA: hypothetical protein ENG13_05480 [bacterium]|nr:hypothetical protein [bacterium]HEX68492.1 hypothetical protein [bacterium]
MRIFRLILLLLLLIRVSSLSGLTRKEVSLSIYNQNFALVKDVRVIPLKKGINRVEFSEVPSLLEPESVLFQTPEVKFPVYLLEQNYQFDLVSPDKLLEKYLGKKIKVIVKKEEVIEGKLLNFERVYLVLEKEKGRLVMVRREDLRSIEFPSLPEGLMIQPTLVWLIDSQNKGKVTAVVSYITKGINWKADYVCVLDKDEKFIDWEGWVTIENRSGANYFNAKVNLIAGEVHRVEKRPPIYREMLAKAVEAAPPPQFEEKPFFEYHLYHLKRPTDIRDREIKQISLMEAHAVPFKKYYEYDAARDPKKVAVYVNFKNSSSYNMGMPLPKGKVRIYKEREGGMEFIGEDKIDHTPKDEEIKLFVGKAFDLVGERKVVERKKVGARAWEIKVEISLRNHKKEPVEIVVKERFWGEWEILTSTHSWEKVDAKTASFKVRVKPDKEEKILYQARYRW